MTIQKTTRIVNFFILVTLGLAGLGIYWLADSIKTLQNAERERLILLSLADELRTSSKELTTAIRIYTVTGEPAALDRYRHAAAVRTGQEPRPQNRQVEPGVTRSLLLLLEQYGCTREELSLLAEANRRSEALINLEKHAIELVNQNKNTEAVALVFGPEYEQETIRIAEPVDRFSAMLGQRIEKRINDSNAAVETNVVILYVLIGFVVVLSILSIAYVDRRIVIRLGRCSGFAASLADGKLDQSLAKMYNDEIGTMIDVLNSMAGSLKQKIEEAHNASETAQQKQKQAEAAMLEAEEARARAESARREGMLQAADRLSLVVAAVSDASKSLDADIVRSDQGAKEQAHLAMETAASMEEMNSAVLAVARSASDAASASENVRIKAQEGSAQVAEAVRSMEELYAASSQISTDMHNLGKHAEGIGQILSVISDIADQTNLLALNAAIEAARAGEAGRGFAVVADEVRKLAEKTMAATREVGDAIQTIQESVKSNIANVTASGELTNKVSEIVTQSGRLLEEILHLAETSADQVRSIATASEQQSASSESINHSVDNISTISGQTVEAMEEAQTALNELSRQAEQLMTLITEMQHS